MNILNKLNNFCYILHKFMGNLVTFKKRIKFLNKLFMNFIYRNNYKKVIIKFK